MIPQQISHYRLLEQIGSGGMGVVYRAEDLQLGRPVAIKFLSEKLAADAHALERFQREARAAAALNHPNICTIYEVGEHEGRPFLALELLQGSTLRHKLSAEPLPVQQILELGIQLADALDVAHSAGILHRDLKPANIFITQRGQAKILDFGLAKLHTQGAAASGSGMTMTAAEPLTDAGGTVGTIGYMSPEQVRGDAADQRADIFALGVVLYEMATGKQPFAGGTTGVVFDAILNRPPISPVRLNPHIPLELERVINTALEKDPELRYQSAAELRAELKRLVRDSSSGVHTPQREEPSGRKAWPVPVVMILIAALVGLTMLIARRSRGPSTVQAHQVTVAVLPFQNATGDASLDYLKLALPDEISTSLSYAAALAVRPQATTRRYDRAEVDIDAAARDLRVANIITGQVSREGAQLRVALEAIEIEGMRVRWRDSIAVNAADLISLRERLASRVRQGLLPAFGQSTEDGPATRPSNSEAYNLYLQSTALSSDNAPNREAIGLLEKAVALDPNYAPAWSYLAARLYWEANYGQGGLPVLARAEAAVQQALRLDPALLQAMRVNVVMLAEKGDLVAAFNNAKATVARRPETAEAHFMLGYVLRYAGLLEESARECEIAYGLDANRNLRSCSITMYLKGDYQRAWDFMRLDEGSEWVRFNTPEVLLRQGRREEVLRMATDERDGFIACLQGRPSPEMPEAIQRAVQGRIDSEPRYHIAGALSFCGHTEPAAAVLAEAIARNYCSYPAIENDPMFANLRKRPEFARLRAAGQECQRRFLAQGGR